MKNWRSSRWPFSPPRRRFSIAVYMPGPLRLSRYPIRPACAPPAGGVFLSTRIASCASSAAARVRSFSSSAASGGSSAPGETSSCGGEAFGGAFRRQAPAIRARSAATVKIAPIVLSRSHLSCITTTSLHGAISLQASLWTLLALRRCACALCRQLRLQGPQPRAVWMAVKA